MSSKMARKLTKLEMEKEKGQTELGDCFRRFHQEFEHTLAQISDSLEHTWKNIRLSSLKQVPVLPTRASPQDMKLSLANSGRYLSTIIQQMSHPTARAPAPDLQYYSRKDPQHLDPSQASNTINLFTYLDLAGFEDIVASDSVVNDRVTPAECAQKLKNTIVVYLENAKTAYDGYADQLSGMAICAMELWVALDKLAVKAMPLLADHPVPFPEDLMYNVLAPTEEDMDRILDIEDYLSQRHAGVRHELLSIFAAPMHNCLAERFFDQDVSLQAALKKMEAKEADLRDKKSKEFATKKAEYENIVKRRASLNCAFMIDHEGDQVHNDKRCEKCYLGRCARRVNIGIHERPARERCLR